MIDIERLKILTESAKYDVSCSSSGSRRQNTKDGMGNAAACGICHSFTPDGRCISLMKILLSNRCAYNCLYCPNRAEADVPRASATPDEICELVISFYKRNYIEGLFLSSAVDGSPDATMEKMLETVVKLREVYHFNGYIHLKGIPHADRLLTSRAAMYADRMSYNVELPSEKSLKLLAPQKNKESVLLPMRQLALEKREANEEKGKRQKFLPAGQTTQMIVGASPESDGEILKLSEAMYRKFSLKRVYYSSYIPVVAHSPAREKRGAAARTQTVSGGLAHAFLRVRRGRDRGRRRKSARRIRSEMRLGAQKYAVISRGSQHGAAGNAVARAWHRQYRRL